MSQFHWGKKRFDFKNGLPRLYLHEKNETIVRWILRFLIGLGIVLSVFTFTWYFALIISIMLVLIDWFLERTLFYYTSMYVSDMILDYDPDQWVANVIVSIGEPEDPNSRKIVGIWLKTEEYAKKFFDVLHNWTGKEDQTQGDLCLTFIVDEDSYYVFIYTNPMRESFKKFAEDIKQENILKKFGKEHFPLFMQQILCKGFATTQDFALGMFIDNHPNGKEFLLAPYVSAPNSTPRPSESVEPIYMTEYKFKLPHELTKDDFEYYHWHKIVERKALGAQFSESRDTLPK